MPRERALPNGVTLSVQGLVVTNSSNGDVYTFSKRRGLLYDAVVSMLYAN